jgi:protein-tyrosine-phosphatase
MTLAEQATVHAALGETTRLTIVAELELGDRTFQELTELVGLRGNLVAHHLDVLDRAGLITRHVSEGDRRRRYIALNPEPLLGLLHPRRMAARAVLFVCTSNSARSQYAAAAWRRRTGLAADSAGTQPAARVHPRAVQVAMEVGIDLRDCEPKGYDHLSPGFDLVVSVCDRAREAELPLQTPSLHWSVPDPVVRGRLRSFRDAFADIDQRLGRLAASVDAGSAGSPPLFNQPVRMTKETLA